MRSPAPFPLSVLGTACFTAAAAAAAPSIFQGNSVIIRPHLSRLPAEAKLEASNFYCYFTEFGYLSFGWWLPVGHGAMDHRHCKPKPESYDWYEYSIAGDCNGNDCQVTVLNYDAGTNSSAKDGPAFQEHYVIKMLDVGDGRLGDLAVSYFDKPNGGFAVGTRRILSRALDDDSVASGVAAVPSAASSATDDNQSQACHDAYDTFVHLQAARQIPLNFTLENPCGPLPKAGDFTDVGPSEL